MIAAAVCYGVGWFMSGTVTEPWQFYLWFSLVAAIVEGHGGSIVVARSPSGGARFRLRIPLDLPRPEGRP